MDWLSGKLIITFQRGNSTTIHDISFAKAQAWIERNHAEGSSYIYYPYATSMSKK